MNNLKEFANEININLNDEKIEKFLKYKEMLKEWNEKINLTAIVEDNDIIIKHFIDSLTIEKYVGEKIRLIDVGTGAGFPGIPLKIVKSNIELTLMDSLKKRLIFLNEVSKELKLENVQIIHGRAEDIGKDVKYRETYDIATARAVANINVLWEYCLPLVKVGGIFICMKGSNIEELEESEKALEKLGGKIEKVEEICLPGTEIERNIIIIRKVKNTPKEYPRKAGVPSKNPIK